MNKTLSFKKSILLFCFSCWYAIKLKKTRDWRNFRAKQAWPGLQWQAPEAPGRPCVAYIITTRSILTNSTQLLWKDGMRHYHLMRNQSYYCQTVRLDKMWTLVSEQIKCCQNKTGTAAISDVVQFSYYSSGKGKALKVASHHHPQGQIPH